MSFLDNPKTLGYLFMIVGILNAIGAIVGVVTSLTSSELGAGYAVTAIGGLIAAIIIIMFAMKVLKGTLSRKNDIFAGMIKVLGITGIIQGVFEIIASFMSAGDLVAGIVAIIIGIIIYLIGQKIDNGFGKILWIILVIVFIIAVLTGIAGVIAAFSNIGGLVSAIATLLINIIGLVYLFDDDIRNA